MPRLNLCIMVHIEDTDNYEEGKAAAYARLSSMMYNRGAKMSWQFDVNYFKVGGGGTYPPLGDPPTSLTYLIANGHNWWIHNHCATYEHLTTTWARVCSAYQRERNGGGIDPIAHVIGRSGGNDPNNAVDFVSISVHSTSAKPGLRALNAPTQGWYTYTPLSLRPMRYINQAIEALHRHDRAPGNTNEAFGTRLTQRPIWADTASFWDVKANTINAVYSGSIVVLPHPGNYSLEKLSEARTAFRGQHTLTTADLNIALTQIWSCYQTSLQMESINNLWYVHLPPTYCLTSYHSMLDDWVRSINEIMDVAGGAPKGIWRNMNEITSLAYHPVSRYEHLP